MDNSTAARAHINQSQPNLGRGRDNRPVTLEHYPDSNDVTPQSSPVLKKRGLLRRRGSQFSKKLASLTGLKTSTPSPQASPKLRRVDSPKVPSSGSSPVCSSASSSKEGSDSVDNTSQILRAIQQQAKVSLLLCRARRQTMVDFTLRRARKRSLLRPCPNLCLPAAIIVNDWYFVS